MPVELPYYRPAPNSEIALFPHDRHAAVVAAETIPEEIIDGVVTNKELTGYLPKEFHFMFEPLFLKQNAHMSIPLELTGPVDPENTAGWYAGYSDIAPETHRKNIKTNITPGRCLPVGYGLIPILVEGNSFFASHCSVKGCFLTGRYYNTRSFENINPDTPLGLFGEREAQKEIEFSNLCLEQGLRVAPALGYLRLNGGQLQEWLSKKWQSRPLTVERVNESLKIFHENNDYPVLLFRLGGVSSRIGEMSFLKNWELESLKYRRQRRADIQRSAKLFLAEAVAFPDQFSSYFPGKASEEACLRALAKISGAGKNPELNSLEMDGYIQFLTAIIALNSAGLEKIIRSKPWLIKSHIIAGLTMAKDTDLVLIQQDFELIDFSCRGPNNSLQATLDDYISSSCSNLAGYIKGNFLPTLYPNKSPAELWELINSFLPKALGGENSTIFIKLKRYLHGLVEKKK